jgi:hypothetical protein
VDEPAEDVSTDDLPTDQGGRARNRLFEVEAAMRPSPVVVLDVLGKD